MAARDSRFVPQPSELPSEPSGGASRVPCSAVLCLDGDLSVNDAVAAAVRGTPTDVHFATGWAHALRSDLAARYGAIIIDADARYEEPALHRLHLCKLLSAASDMHAVIVLHRGEDRELATVAMRNGAFDVLSKPLCVDAVVDVLNRASAHARAELRSGRRNEQAEEQSSAPRVTAAEVEVSAWPPPALRDIARRLSSSRYTDGNLLITGESGTGKAALAALVHASSERHDAPFVRVNCVGLSAPELEAVLFGALDGRNLGQDPHVVQMGHGSPVRGAPSAGGDAHASHAQAGAFVRADGGTILLHLIDHLPVESQVLLLRTIRERVVSGPDKTPRPVDVRVIATASERLESQVVAGEFLEALYHRLNSSRAVVPPLREQRQDLPAMANHLLATRRTGQSSEAGPGPGPGAVPGLSLLSESAIEVMRAHTWPGNFRELENVLRRAQAVCTDDTIRAEHLELDDAIRHIPVRPSRPHRIDTSTVDNAAGGLGSGDTTTDLGSGSGSVQRNSEVEFAVGDAALSHRNTAPEVERSLGSLFERWLRQQFPHRPVPSGTRLPAPGEVERAYLSAVVEATGGSKSLAAMALGMARRTLYRRLEEGRTQGRRSERDDNDAQADRADSFDGSDRTD